MTYTYPCAGYEGHKCNVTVIYKRKLRPNVKPLCPKCRVPAGRSRRAEYQRDYYIAHRDEAIAYQREYNRRFKKAYRKQQEYARNYATTSKKQEREEIKSTYNHSDLMHRPTESFEKAINRILSGKCELAAVK